MLSAVFQFSLPKISSSLILKDLIRSFRIERLAVPVRVPPWDLAKVLEFLKSSTFEPLHEALLRELTKKTFFLLSLATAKRVEELQAVAKTVFCG